MLLKGGLLEGRGKEWWKGLGKKLGMGLGKVLGKELRMGLGGWLMGGLLFLLMGDVALGRPFVWVGEGDGVSWADKANWDPARSPSSGDVVVIEEGMGVDASGVSFWGSLQLGELGCLSMEQWGMFGDSSLEGSLFVSSSLRVMDEGVRLDVGRQGRILFGAGSGNVNPQLDLGRYSLTISGCLETVCAGAGGAALDGSAEVGLPESRNDGMGMRLMRRYLMGLDEGVSGKFGGYCSGGEEWMGRISGVFYDAEGSLMSAYEGLAEEWELLGGVEGQFLMGRMIEVCMWSFRRCSFLSLVWWGWARWRCCCWYGVEEEGERCG